MKKIIFTVIAMSMFLFGSDVSSFEGVLEISCQSDKILSRTDNERRIRI